MAKETINNGWICLHRAMREWQWYDNPTIKAVFIDLLFSACTEPTWFKGRKLSRGQSVISVETLAQNNGISKPTAIKALKQLEDSGEIIRNKWKFYIITTICNYSKYQDFNLSVSKKSLPTTLPTILPTTLPNKQYNNNNNIIERYNNGRTCEQIWEDVKAMTITIEQFCKTENITPEEFNELGEAVLVDWALTGDKGDRKYLINAIRRKAQAMREQGQLVRGTLAERKQRFLGECKALVDKGCDRESVAEFARYYTQLEQGGERMLFETYKGWNTETRYLINQQLKQKKQ